MAGLVFLKVTGAASNHRACSSRWKVRGQASPACLRESVFPTEMHDYPREHLLHEGLPDPTCKKNGLRSWPGMPEAPDSCKTRDGLKPASVHMDMVLVFRKKPKCRCPSDLPFLLLPRLCVGVSLDDRRARAHLGQEPTLSSGSLRTEI